ncbi:MAG: FG-GAP repeat protein [Planctomycetota bacterium]
MARSSLLVALAVVGCTLPASAAPQFIPRNKLIPAPPDSGAVAGQSVSVSGDRLAIGALQEGAVYIYVRDQQRWVLEQRIVSSAGEGEQFGASLSLDGARLLVGRPFEDYASFNSGAAYVFERGPGGWVEVQRLLPSDPNQLDNFGCSVALSGDRMLLGAQYDDDRGTSSGSAYVFERFGGQWIEVAKLVAQDGAAGDLAGWSVALDGGVAAVGAWARQATLPFGGAIFVYEGAGSLWNQVATLESSRIRANQCFGVSVAVQGRRIVGGATGSNHGVFVFEGGPGGWVETGDIPATGPQFGCSVALSGPWLVVGAQQNSLVPTFNPSGTVHLYRQGVQGRWRLRETLVPRDDTAAFGCSVSLREGRLVVGARSDAMGDGAVYTFDELIATTPN